MVKIHTFITEDDVNYYRQMTNEKIKEIINYPHSRELYVLWTGSDEKDQHFLSINKMIYKIRYGHKALVLYQNICNKTDRINKADEEQSLDDIITKYPNFLSGFVVFLDEYFGQKFFWKNHEWIPRWQDFLYPNDITILNGISTENGLFRIEITNISYPYLGYILLDLNEAKIVQSGKYY
jgi:hypothetical protein